MEYFQLFRNGQRVALRTAPSPLDCRPAGSGFRTKPNCAGSAPVKKTIGIVAVAALAASRWGHGGRSDDSHSASRQVGGEPRKAIVPTVPAEVDNITLRPST